LKNAGQVVTNVKGAFNNNFFKIKYTKEIDKDYFVYFLRAENTQIKILTLAGTSTIPDLNHGDFYKMEIKLPLLAEQNKSPTAYPPSTT
jgi:type I restriction enzyme S subunit